MGEGGRVDQDEGGAVAAGGLDPVHQHVLGIGLEAVQVVAGLGGAGAERGFDLRQGGVAVDARLAFTEQVQVRTMQYWDLRHAGLRKGGTVWRQARPLSRR